MALKFLSATLTQGSADAFTTVEIPTGLSNVNLGYRVRLIECSLPLFVEVDSQIEIALVRRTPTATPGIGDRTLIWQSRWQIGLTTSGIYLASRWVKDFYPRDLEMLIVEDPIHLCIDSNGTSASNACGIRVWYEEVRLTELQKVTALSESLNA